MRYLITFACYGTHFHGDESGTVDRDHNLHGSRFLDADPLRSAAERGLMDQPPYLLDAGKRVIVLQSLREVCRHRGWFLVAAHVRQTHVHLVVEAEERPEKIMNVVKANASRKLNDSGSDSPDRKRWARYGSTRWLAKDQQVLRAIKYVVDGQGKAMEVFVAEFV